MRSTAPAGSAAGKHLTPEQLADDRDADDSDEWLDTWGPTPEQVANVAAILTEGPRHARRDGDQ